jgi:hypothetical protein
MSPSNKKATVRPPNILARLVSLFLLACALQAASIPTCAADNAPALLAEVKKSFTVHGKPIPPEIFRDFGDGDMADSGSIWITVDVAAATGSNLYYDDIKQDHDWVVQSKPNQSMNGKETTGYKFVGVTANGLLIVIASFSGGGTGDFMTLHILDAVLARGFDDDGKPYPRITVTNLRSVILGDRWDGDVKIEQNTLHIVTRQNGPVGGTKAPSTIIATRP